MVRVHDMGGQARFAGPLPPIDDDEPAPHTRLPAYARGKRGTVVALRPAQVFPDTAAEFTGENPQHVYEVRFDSRELWGDDAEPAGVTVDLYESYLEKAS